jgi:hypothetical protein
MPKVDLRNPELQFKLKAAGIRWTTKDYLRNGYLEVSTEVAKDLGLTKAHLADEKKMAEKAEAAKAKDAKAAQDIAKANAAEAQRMAEKEAEDRRKSAEAAEEAARKAGRLPGRAL